MFIRRFVRTPLTAVQSFQRPAMSVAARAAQKRDIIALDFDGVICASAEESSASAIKTAQSIWPNAMKTITEHAPAYQQLLNLLKQVRPVIEVGYDGVLLARYINDNAIHLKVFSHEEIVNNILSIFNIKFRKELMEYYNIDQYTLTDAFGKIRDEIITEDQSKWIQLNHIYPHILQHFQDSSLSSSKNHIRLNKDQLYIITTKQERFVRAILNANHLSTMFIKDGRNNNTPLTEKEEDELKLKKIKKFEHHCNIFDLENVYGSKLNVLTELLHQHRIGGKEGGGDRDDEYPILHFVEDRYETVLNIKKQREDARRQSADGKTILDHLQLYLVDWGYNTEKQRAAIKDDPDIQLLSPKGFNDLLERIRS